MNLDDPIGDVIADLTNLPATDPTEGWNPRECARFNSVSRSGLLLGSRRSRRRGTTARTALAPLRSPATSTPSSEENIMSSDDPDPCNHAGHKDCVHYRAWLYAMQYFSGGFGFDSTSETALSYRYKKRVRELLSKYEWEKS